jgi:hypothetical protein
MASKPLFNGSIWNQNVSNLPEKRTAITNNGPKQKRPRVRSKPKEEPKKEEKRKPRKDGKKHSSEWRLDISIMLRTPSQNYKLWDDSEIVPLENYREQFARLKPTYPNDPNFHQNWVNCDAAIKYFYSKILPLWHPTDDSIPLKEAIRTGRAIKTYGSLLDNPKTMDKLLEMHKTGELLKGLEGTQQDLAKRLLKEGKQATLTVDEYLHVKQKSSDTEFKDLLDANKHDRDKLNLVTERRDPCPPEHYDPNNVRHKALCLPLELRAQYLIDKEIESESKTETLTH